MRIAFLFFFTLSSIYVYGQDQIINGNVTAGGSSGYWSGFKSTASAGQWGFQQNNVMMIGLAGNVYSRGFSANAMGIFNGSTTKEDVFLYNQNSPGGDFLVLKNTGNVGIGAAAPIKAFQIGEFHNGSSNNQILIPGTYNFEQLRLGQTGNGNMAMEFVNHSGLNTSYGIRFLVDIDSGVPGLQIQSSESKASYEEMSYSTAMHVSRWGTVGIGILNPQEKLEVSGKIRAKEIKVETSNWPDYVFEPSYKPVSLPELEAYIKANKRLPEIPSAKEAEEDGISLGEMNARLLKKIEELTLHLIEQGKEIKELKAEILSIKK